MKTKRISAILFLAVCLVFCPAKVSEAVLMGTAFSYQGRLIDANNAADGLYDFQFKLFDDPNVSIGRQVGSTIDINELDVLDGYFTAVLNFGTSAFTGDARWLQIGVRPGELEDSNAYTPLLPRQEVTPTPYAIYAQNASADNDWMVSGDNMYSIPTGRVGIGTTSPDFTFTVEREPPVNNINPIAVFRTTGATSSASAIRFENTNNNEFNIGITKDDAFGIAYNSNISQATDLLRITSTGNVGIGTIEPSYKLEVGDTGEANNYVRINSSNWGGLLFYDGEGSHSGAVTYYHGENSLRFQTRPAVGNPVERMRITSDGNVGIGTTSPGEKLHVVGNAKVVDAGGNDAVVLQADGLGSAGQISMYDNDGTQTVRIVAAESSTTGSEIKLSKADGTTTIEIDADFNGDGRIITQELQITGGSDLSEQFDIDGVKGAVKPGMLVSIDPKRPGKLLISNEAYDNKVAGIISGAGGIKPGMMMGQKDSAADGVYPVALSGRVYCWADASTGAIRPGDLLTTSSIPGHAMKVSDHTRALGAIIGKAMTSLEKGKGLVLVLVSLQ